MALTLGDQRLELHDIVRGAESGGHDEGEEQLLGASQEVGQELVPLATAGLGRK